MKSLLVSAVVHAALAIACWVCAFSTPQHTPLVIEVQETSKDEVELCALDMGMDAETSNFGALKAGGAVEVFEPVLAEFETKRIGLSTLLFIDAYDEPNSTVTVYQSAGDVETPLKSTTAASY